jgi:signal transduction histidine kinase
MPWVSQQVRHRVVVVADSRQLPPEAEQDGLEMAACGVSALVTSGFVSNGSMFGSLAMGRQTPGEWPEQLVADLRLLSAALASRISEARARESLADALQRGDLARASQQEFFSAIGHELRTPLAAIVGTAELVGDDAREFVASLSSGPDPHVPADEGTRFAAGVARDSEVVLSAGEHLLGILDELLDSGQELGGGVESQWVDVADAVADVVHWLQAPARSASVTVLSDVPTGVLVLTTPSGLRQILTNLIGNALTYNKPGGSVRVTHARERNEFGDARVRVSVRDTGPGLTPEQQRDVFKPFVRFAPPEVPGTGLGLSLSRSLAERDGGMIGVESVPGEGAVFWIDLPAAAPGSGADAA